MSEQPPDNPAPEPPPEKPFSERTIWEGGDPKTWGDRVKFEAVRFGCLSLVALALFSCIGFWNSLPAGPSGPAPERPAWTVWGWIFAIGGLIYGLIRGTAELWNKKD